MNIGFLNRWRVLVNEHRRALVVGQMLCLIVVAALFFVTPLVAMACGNKNNNVVKTVKIVRKLSIDAVATNVNSQGSPLALNAIDIPPGPATQSIPVDTQVTLAKLTDGKWLVGTYKVDNNPKDDITFQGEIFSRTEAVASDTKKKEKVGEIWIAEIRSNDPDVVKRAQAAGISPGTFLRNVSLNNIPAA
ncbi:MAG TPA: hypothetical protein VGL94_11305 [Ktedonobacteraceae bacterium]|jgi:hypothetical protein